MKRWLALAVSFGSALLIGTGALADERWIDRAWLVKVKPGSKHYLFDLGKSRPECAENELCQTKAYVVAGDVLVAWDVGTLGRGPAKWLEVEYVSRSGRSTVGWIKSVNVEPIGDPPTTPSSWSGSWARTEADIEMQPNARMGTVGVTGIATWGASDPERAKRGLINTGEIKGIFRPKGSLGGFTMGEVGSLPLEGGEDTACSIRFRLLLPYLLAADNGNCGGVNVSFDGVYVRDHS